MSNRHSVDPTGPVLPEPKFDFEAFLSYSTRADYRLAMRLEEFLEGFHEEHGLREWHLAPMRICNDGSDFVVRRPKAGVLRESTQVQEPIKELVGSYLRRSAALVILWPGVEEASSFMTWELREFLRQNVELGWDRPVRLVVTRGRDPASEPGTYFSSDLLEAGLHGEIFYDLRAGHPDAGSWHKVRDFERERLRLAVDLRYPIDTSGKPLSVDELFAGWKRAKVRQERYRRRIIAATAGAIVILGAAAILLGLRARDLRIQSQMAQAGELQNLAQGLLGTIGVSPTLVPTGYEREALWTLATLGPEKERVRVGLLRQWSSTEVGFRTAVRHGGRGFHAALGLRDEAEWIRPMAERWVNAYAQDEPEEDEEEDALAALHFLAARMDPSTSRRTAIRLVDLIEKAGTADLERLAWLGQALADLANRRPEATDPETAARAARIVVQAITNPPTGSHVTILESWDRLGSALQTLFGILEPESAQWCGDALTELLEGSVPLESYCADAAGQALRSWVARSGPSTADAMGTRLLNRLLATNTLGQPQVSVLGETLREAVERASVDALDRLGTRLLDALLDDAPLLASRGQALARAWDGTTPRLPGEKASSLAFRLTTLASAKESRDPDRLARVGNALRVIAGRLDPVSARRVADEVLVAIEPTPEPTATADDPGIIRGATGLLRAIASRTEDSGETESLRTAGLALFLFGRRDVLDQLSADRTNRLTGEDIDAPASETERNVIGSALRGIADKWEAIASQPSPPPASAKPAPAPDPIRVLAMAKALPILLSRLQLEAAAEVAARSGTVLLATLETSEITSENQRIILAEALAGIAAGSDAEAAAELARRTLDLFFASMRPPLGHHREVAGDLEALPKALASLLEYLPPSEAADTASQIGLRFWDTLTATGNRTANASLPQAAHGLAALLPWMPSTNAAHLSGRASLDLLAYLGGMTNRRPEADEAAVAAIARLAPRWDDPTTELIMTTVVDRLREDRFTDTEALQLMLSVLHGAQPRISPKLAGGLANRLFESIEHLSDTALTDSRNAGAYFASFAIGLLAPSLTRTDADSLARRLLASLADGRDTDGVRSLVIGTALAPLADRNPEAVPTRLLAWSIRLNWPMSAPDDPGGIPGDHESWSSACATFDNPNLLEILKWPVCVGKAQEIVLAELERRLRPRRPFEGRLDRLIQQTPEFSLPQELLRRAPKRPHL